VLLLVHEREPVAAIRLLLEQVADLGGDGGGVGHRIGSVRACWGVSGGSLHPRVMVLSFDFMK
jgi:hypothetical protein